jgi:hypothetical protein
MCSIDGCPEKAVAKGLCAKHYARTRRNGGDAAKVRKRGRKTPHDVAVHRQLFREFSARTRARFTKAMRICQRLGIVEEAVKKASRPNGSMNMSYFLWLAEIAESKAAIAAARLLEGSPQD